MKASFWVPLALGTAIQLSVSSVLAQRYPAVAFLADIHLQEVYANLNTANFKGVPQPNTGKLATIRTMESQLNSTRLFNENYFAFIQALDELAEKKIQLVVLPGDFSDDGQPMNVLALQKILQEYSNRYGMRFFLTTGNHDPVSPFGKVGGKTDFLGTSGETQALAGSSILYPNLDAAITDQINHWGYYEICTELAEFGFFPSKKDLFWSHPFEELEYEQYSWTRAQANASLERRSFLIPGTELLVPDASYLVEPVPGLWLLALDGNTYVSKTPSSSRPEEWSSTSTGFNLTSQVKSYQLDWIKKVTAEAKKRGKRLISFSHYPLVEYHNGATDALKSLFGSGKHQLNRAPEPAVTEKYALAGIQVHFAGHMHFNNTSLYKSTTGASLFNLQVPSLAAFPPAYKILEEGEAGDLQVQTELLEEVKGMKDFFDLYRMENRWLSKTNPAAVWNEEILNASDFLGYTRFHLRELIRLRFLKSDWPEELGLLVNTLTTEDLEIWAGLEPMEGAIFLKDLLATAKNKKENPTYEVGPFLEDFYLVKNGGDLGKALIPSQRQLTYSKVFQLKSKVAESTSGLQVQLEKLVLIFSKLMQGLPSDDFVIDLQSLEIKRSQ